jgi:hypothetical protein
MQLAIHCSGFNLVNVGRIFLRVRLDGNDLMSRNSASHSDIIVRSRIGVGDSAAAGRKKLRHFRCAHGNLRYFARMQA